MPEFGSEEMFPPKLNFFDQNPLYATPPLPSDPVLGRSIEPEAVAAVLTDHVSTAPTPPEQPLNPSLEGPDDGKKYGALFGGGLDPLTAGFNAAAAFFNFLSTEQGQRVCKDIIDLDHLFANKVKDVFDKIHSKVSG